MPGGTQDHDGAKAVKIAICLNGQPRTWRICHSNWFQNFVGDHEFDIFFHFWDYNTYPTLLLTVPGGPNKLEDVTVTDQEKQEILDTLKPKNYVFDSRKLSKLSPDSYKNNYVSNPLGWWCRSQFYSLQYAARLKRQYEIEQNFEYDFVLRWRTDIWLEREVHFPELIEPNTLYSSHNGWMDNARAFQVGDMLFGADSFTYDQIANLHEGFDFFDTHHIVPHDVPCPPPEVIIYPFVKSLGIKNQNWSQVFKTYRTQEYINLKGRVEPYETTEHSNLSER